MNKKFADELRDMNLEIEGLKARKEAIKKKALEHRDSLTKAERDSMRAEGNSLKEQIEKLEKRRDELSTSAEKNEKGDDETMNNTILHFKEGMERVEIFSTAEYRSAYFKSMQGRELNEMEKRAITSVQSSGGAAIPTQTMNEIIGQLSETPNLLGLITLLNIPELTSFPVENVVNDAEWLSEDAESTAKDDSLNSISLSAHKLMKTIKVTAKVAKMSIDAFEKWVVSTITRKMRAACNKAVIAGTGVNQPKGLNGETWDKNNSIEVAANASISYDNLVDLEALVGEDFIQNAVFVMNRKTKAQVAKIKDDNKRPIFERALENGFAGLLLGYPVRPDKNVADGEIYFGDWKAAYVMNFPQDVEFASSQEAGFMSGSTVYRGLALVDGKPTGVKGAMVKIKKAAATQGSGS